MTTLQPVNAAQSAEIISQWIPRLVAFETEFFTRHAYSEPTAANDCALETFIEDYGVILEQFEGELGDASTAKRVRALANSLASQHAEA